MPQIRARVGHDRSTKGQIQVSSTFEIVDELDADDSEHIRAFSDFVRVQAKRQMEQACEDMPFDPNI